jgi:hypothetical protein
MKIKFLAFLLMLPMLAFCDKPTPEPDPDQGPDDAPTSDIITPEPETPKDDEIVLPPEITDGCVVLACNENVHKFLTEVTYPDHDYSYSVVMDYYGGYNGKLKEGDAVKSDKPAEYSIRWTANKEAGDLTLKLSEPTWSMEQAIDAGESYVSVTNLVPNTHYTYSVTAADGTVMTEGKFDTYGSIHQVYFKHSVRNARDLGGWKTYDGKMVKYRMIYRGGRLGSSYISRSGMKAILAEGIRAQLDIRGESDVNKEPTLPEFEFCAPIIKTGGDDMLVAYDKNKEGAQKGDKMRECMQFVIDMAKANKPVYFHCSLGRDRTGTLALIILGLLDVVEGDISKEYEVTYFAPRGWSIAESETYKTFQNKRTTWAYKPTAEHIWKNYVKEGERFSQGVERYLLEIGISQEDIDAYREIMIVDAYPDLTPAE